MKGKGPDPISSNIDVVSCSICITTHNRCSELELTLEALQKLFPRPKEILIVLDGCTDGTAGMIRESLLNIRVFTNSTGRGSIPSRDLLIREARGDLVLSLDDDSYPLEPDSLKTIALLFDADPDLAVAWFPQKSDEFPESLSSEWTGRKLTGTYSSSGACIRRSMYLSQPGYPGFFGHAYEEPDYALQCIANGFRVVWFSEVTIRHHYSPVNRNEIRTHHFHARNEQWSVWMRCPWPWLPLVSGRRALGQFRYACTRGLRWVVREPLWWAKALSGFPRVLSERRALRWNAYRRWMRLLRNPEPVKARENGL